MTYRLVRYVISFKRDAARCPFTTHCSFRNLFCRWIQQRDNWGGAIELFILSQFYGKEIAAYDIQTKRCDIYGQDKGTALPAESL